jgi:hypothetical protein
MQFMGRFSLKKNGVPGETFAKSGLALGCQKLTSSNRRLRKKSNHLLSVTPTQKRI